MTKGWTENRCNPGGSWLYYDDRGDNRAIVFFGPWTGGRYEWRVARGWMAGGDLVGWSSTLADAQQQAERAMTGEGVQEAHRQVERVTKSKYVQMTMFTLR
jgi:hypothetical protein